ncbi:MAG: hypothetical protein EBV29_03735 [Gammaproteobacteria bacterium]|nr:hypothetical protein [Gammaproteobacteria bacterium]
MLEQRLESDHALTTDDQKLRRETVLEHVVHRDDAAQRKDHVGISRANFLEHLAVGETQRLQARRERFTQLVRQRKEQFVPIQFFDSNHL